MVVCHAAQENRKRSMCKLREYANRNNKVAIHNSMIFYSKNTKVHVEVLAYQGRLHTKFEENCIKHFQDMSEQTFKFFSSSFCTLEKIAVTRKLVLQSS